MSKYFSQYYKGNDFVLFGETHIITLSILFIIGTLILIFTKEANNKKMTKNIPIVFAIILILFECAYVIWSILSGYFSVAYSLPLQLCDITLILTAVMLLKKSYSIFEIVYFLGLAGDTQALLTPEIGQFNFPHFFYINFFVTHGIVIFSVLYITLIEGYKPKFKSIWKALIITNLLAVLAGIVNILVKGNYMFLCSKPSNSSLLDFLGPWPWYILVLEVVAAGLFIILYIPFYIKDLLDKDNYRSQGISF